MSEKLSYHFGDEVNFMHNLDNFILSCLKDHSINGSLTKTEMKKWFADKIDLEVENAQRRMLKN